MTKAVARNPDDTFAVLRERCEKSCAERDAFRACLRDVLALFDRKAHMPHEQQLVIARADALVKSS